jgi:hypothetical protein
VSRTKILAQGVRPIHRVTALTYFSQPPLLIYDLSPAACGLADVGISLHYTDIESMLRSRDEGSVIDHSKSVRLKRRVLRATALVTNRRGA